jgi:hypothetical protein
MAYLKRMWWPGAAPATGAARESTWSPALHCVFRHAEDDALAAPGRKVARPVVAVLRLAQVRARSMLVFAYSARRLLQLKDAAQR